MCLPLVNMCNKPFIPQIIAILDFSVVPLFYSLCSGVSYMLKSQYFYYFRNLLVRHTLYILVN